MSLPRERYRKMNEERELECESCPSIIKEEVEKKVHRRCIEVSEIHQLDLEYIIPRHLAEQR